MVFKHTKSLDSPTQKLLVGISQVLSRSNVRPKAENHRVCHPGIEKAQIQSSLPLVLSLSTPLSKSSCLASSTFLISAWHETVASFIPDFTLNCGLHLWLNNSILIPTYSLSLWFGLAFWVPNCFDNPIIIIQAYRPNHFYKILCNSEEIIMSLSEVHELTQ